MKMFRKITDLKPWLDYFEMLRAYIQGGCLEMLPAANEAYITEPALHALSYADDMPGRLETAKREGNKQEEAELCGKMWKAIRQTISYLRAYSDFLNAAAEGYKMYVQLSEDAPDTPATGTATRQANDNMRKPQIARKPSDCFAVHVVAQQYPHNLQYTILVIRRRRWYWPWRKADRFDVINY